MAKYFTLEELTQSDTATKKGIDNTPTEETIVNLNYLMDSCLDTIRGLWGKPIQVNSGYRCEELNKALGGARTSQHLVGCAADITTGTLHGNKELFKMITSSNVDFDQLIDENNYRWIHVSCKYQSKGNRKQVLHLKA